MGTSQSTPAHRGSSAAGPSPAAEEVLGWLGDEIDDRVAEVLPEILAEQATRRAGRPDLVLAAFGLLAALAATFVLRDHVIAVCVVWPCAALVCLAAARSGRRRS